MGDEMCVSLFHLTVELPSQKSHNAIERSRVLNVKEVLPPRIAPTVPPGSVFAWLRDSLASRCRCTSHRLSDSLDSGSLIFL